MPVKARDAWSGLGFGRRLIPDERVDELNRLRPCESGPEEERHANREEPPRLGLGRARRVADRVLIAPGMPPPSTASSVSSASRARARLRRSAPNGSSHRNNSYAKPPARTLAAMRLFRCTARIGTATAMCLSPPSLRSSRLLIGVRSRRRTWAVRSSAVRRLGSGLSVSMATGTAPASSASDLTASSRRVLSLSTVGV